MHSLDQIVNEINGAIAASLQSYSCIKDADLHGIAVQAVRQNGEKKEIIPAICDNEGKYDYIGPEDDYSYRSYHRVARISYTKGTAFGSKQRKKDVAEMLYIVHAQRNLIKKSPAELLQQVVSWLPETLSKEKLENMKLLKYTGTALAGVLDPLVVFGQEFRGIDYFLRPEDIYLSISYKIESEYDPLCFNTCGCNDSNT